LIHGLCSYWNMSYTEVLASDVSLLRVTDILLLGAPDGK